MAGIKILAVGYRGGPDIYSDLLAGGVKLCLCNIVTALPLVRGGKLRAPAITLASRSALAPDLPTMHCLRHGTELAAAPYGNISPRAIGVAGGSGRG